MPSPHAQRAAIARAVRDGQHEEAARLRAAYYGDKIADLITTSPLTTDQVERLTTLLAGRAA